jgi:FtsH-binding integral membrane protein
LPKTPSPPQGELELNTWQVNRFQRVVGKLLFGVGLAFALGGVLLPLEYWSPVFLCLTLAAFAAGIWYRVKLRREPSPTES